MSSNDDNGIENAFCFTTALTKQRADFNVMLTKHREEFNMMLANHGVELHKIMMAYLWRVYGLAVLLMGGVYFIARYVH